MKNFERAIRAEKMIGHADINQTVIEIVTDHIVDLMCYCEYSPHVDFNDVMEKAAKQLEQERTSE